MEDFAQKVAGGGGPSQNFDLRLAECLSGSVSALTRTPSRPEFHWSLAASKSTTPKASPVTPTVTCFSTPSPTPSSAPSPPETSEPSSRRAIRNGKAQTPPSSSRPPSGGRARRLQDRNIDCVLVMHRPKIVPIAGELRERVAELLQLDMKN